MAISTDAALAQLKQAGRRSTKQRAALIEVMREFAHPATVEQIFQRITKRYRMIDLVTVYRILGTLEDIGMVHRSFGPTGTTLFSLRQTPRPYFALIRRKGEFLKIDAATSAAVESSAQRIEELLAKRGFGEVAHVVQFFVDEGAASEADAKKVCAAAPAHAASRKGRHPPAHFARAVGTEVGRAGAPAAEA